MTKKTKKTKAVATIEEVQSEEIVVLNDEEVNALIENLKKFDLDENKIQILYRYSSSTVNLITLTLSEGNNLSLYSTSGYIGWMKDG